MGSERRKVARETDATEAIAADRQAAPSPPMLGLQRAAGNRAVVAMLAAAGAQPKLDVGPAGDSSEREADETARRVVQSILHSQPGSGSGVSADDDQGAAPIRRRSEIGAEGGPVDAETERAITAARGGGGSPLADPVRRQMETAFGSDFGAVRLHTGDQATELNERIQAKAFTIGSDIFFRGSAPDAGTTAGQELLAHELTHTVQQGAAPQISRKFAPYTVKEKTHLRKGAVDKKSNETKAKTGLFGRTGDNLQPGEELVVDTDQKSGEFSRAVKVKHDAWKPSTPRDPATFVRTEKLTPVAQPDGNGKYFHHKLGPMQWVDGPKSMSPGALFREYPNSPLFVKIGPGGEDLSEYGDLTLGDHKKLGHLIELGAQSDDAKDMYGLKSKANMWVKANRDDELVVAMTSRSLQEQIRCFEGTQVKLANERKNLAEQLGTADGPTTTVAVPYASANGVFTGNVKITGKANGEHYPAQKEAIETALAQLAPSNVPVPDGLEFVISSTLNTDMKNEAVHTGAGIIFLRGNIFDHKVVDDVDQTDTDIRGGSPKQGILGVCHHVAARAGKEAQGKIVAVSTIIHEIGHVIHRTNNPALFEKYRMGLDAEDDLAESKQKSALSKKVSHYAWNAGATNVTELVAEVFTGIMNGEKYDQEVIDAYLKYGGTKTWTKDSDVVKNWTPSTTKTGV